MKKLFSLLTIFAFLVTSCSKDPGVDSIDVQQNLKTVVLSADMGSTKASLDSESGAFAWQSGDVISVLATDGKFYDFTLVSGEGTDVAEFEGGIPQTAEVTTVATYPRFVANGSDNTVYASGVLNYSLPTEWTYVKDASNVPMVATFDEAADYMSFRQIGGVLRFPVKNMPMEADFVLTVEGKAITGSFPVELANLGTEGMTAGDATSTLTIHYSSEVYGESVEFNVPVPAGVYNKFNVTIKDGDEVLLTKDYVKADGETDRTVERADLVVMPELELVSEPMAIAEVWPFFVDARVVFNKFDADGYAFYIDGATTPVTNATVEELADGRLAALIGGDFEHNTPHTVAIAKVMGGQVIEDTKSPAVEFTTGRVMQLTYNTGTKFISAAWDDVAIGTENSTVYNEATKKWSLVPKNEAVSGRDLRGYRVQLYDESMNLIYDEVPFSGQVDYGGAFANSSWLGKSGGENYLLPTALSFGWLEPGKKYYFRVQTLAEPVVFDSVAKGYFAPDGAGVTVQSTRGGCGWSDFVEMKTDAAHIALSNEVFFEGFDDMMFNGDMMNLAPAAVPEFLTAESSKYNNIASAALYRAWADKPFAERKFSEQGFNTTLGVYFHGLTDDTNTTKNVPSYLNEYAGSLEGWSVVVGSDGKNKRTANPNFGSIRLGESGTASGKTELRTIPIMSDKLSETVPTKCIITVKVSAHATTEQNINSVLGVYHYRGETTLNNKNTIQFNLDANGNVLQDWSDNYTWTDSSNYLHYPTWFEVKTELNLLKGDVIGFEKANPKVDGVSDFYGGQITIGEVLIEVAPKEFEDDGVGTEPDNTDYDVFGMGEIPISFWWTVPTAAHNYDEARTVELYREMAESGINVVNYVGEVDYSLAENKRIMDICTDLDMKFIGNVLGYATNAERIAAVKSTLATSTTYIGEHLSDEPSVHKFDELAEFVNLYNQELPDEEVYINLFPIYANAATQLGTNYENYVNRYMQTINTKSVSFDYYGLRNGVEVGSDIYTNLDLVRSKTLAAKKPFWVITQAGADNVSKPGDTPKNKQPNEVEQRWTVWANLALGSKGIAYFCYWTPSVYPNTYFMIDHSGNQTDNYRYIKQINEDIYTIGKKLLYCHADGAIMTNTRYYPLYENSGAGRSKYGPIQSMSGSVSSLCGCFRDARVSENGENYKGYKALVMSEFPNRDDVVNLTLDTSVTKVTITSNNTSGEVLLANNMAPQNVGEITISYSNGVMTLGIPSGEAALIEF